MPNIYEGVQVATITIANSTTLSDSIKVDAARFVIGIELPVLNSTIVYIQAASTQNGTYKRILDQNGDDLEVASAATTGSRMRFLADIAPFQFLKVECGTAQTANRIFNFIMRPFEV